MIRYTFVFWLERMIVKILTRFSSTRLNCDVSEKVARCKILAEKKLQLLFD